MTTARTSSSALALLMESAMPSRISGVKALRVAGLFRVTMAVLPRRS